MLTLHHTGFGGYRHRDTYSTCQMVSQDNVFRFGGCLLARSSYLSCPPSRRPQKVVIARDEYLNF